jgi:DNA-directed RNA polymerase subunit RPC12/RpoP
MTVTLRCLNCGFTFTVTYPAPVPAEENTRPVSCGHCRSSHWSSQAA